MSKYHLGSKGEPALCTASERPCPVGGDHFESSEDARAHYERSMAYATFAPSTSETVRAMRDVEEDSPKDNVVRAAATLTDANLFTDGRSESLRARLGAGEDVWPQLHVVDAIMDRQANAAVELAAVARTLSAGADPAGAPHPSLPHLEKLKTELLAAGKLASGRLTAIWDEENRRWTDREEMGFLHDLMNQQAKALNRTNALLRALR